jgi:hypothetical protein
MKYQIKIYKDKSFEKDIIVRGKSERINCDSTAQVTLYNDYGLVESVKDYGYITLEEKF